MKIGIFGGTFDPIHLGHINLALEIKEKCSLDKIYFCPARQSPLKKKQPHVSINDRLTMVKLAISDIQDFEILDFERDTEGPSYTIETLKRLKAIHRSDELFFLAGEDVLAHFSFWKDPEGILTYAKPLIGHRGHLHNAISEIAKKHQEIFQKGMIPISLFDVSSTGIRDRLEKKLYCGHLLSPKVLDYIQSNGLY